MLPTALLVLASLASAPQQAAPQEDTTRVRGRVVDMRGEGVPAASIQISDWLTPDKVLTTTATDGEGYFLSGKVKKRGGFQVHCSAEDRCNAIVYAKPDRTTYVVVHDAVTVTGTLHDRAGKPIAGALIRSSYEGRGLFNTISDGHTDEHGKFTLHAVALGYNRFSTWIDGAGLTEVRRKVDGPCEVALVESNEATTSMTIKIAGLPEDFAEHIAITLLPYDNGNLMYLPPPMRKPTTNGKWHADHLPDWNYTMYLQHPEFSFEPNRVQRKRASGPHEVRFVARKLKTELQDCEASVVGPNQQPLENVTMRLSRRNGSDPADATTDGNGELTWQTTLRAGTKIKIQPRDENWVTAFIERGDRFNRVFKRSNNSNQGTLTATNRFEVTLAKACQVAGRVVLADGRPAGMLAVRLEYHREGQWPKWQAYDHASTARDGTFTFRQLPATADQLRLAADTPIGSVQSEAFFLKESGMRVQLPEARLSAPAIIEGVVLDATQQPMPGVTIWLREWDMQKNTLKNGSVTEVISDRLGRYRFVGVPLGGAGLQLVRAGETAGMKAVGDAFGVAEGNTYTRNLIGTGY